MKDSTKRIREKRKELEENDMIEVELGFITYWNY